MIHAHEPGRPSTHRGFTLLELVVSTVVLSVIMVGLGSAMLIAGRALPGTRSVATATMAAADAAEGIGAELRYATAINQRSATMIEFVVPDRNGDGLPETIRYEWSGASGAPLTRRYNAGTAVEALADVREFSLSYETETISTQIPQNNESAETQLIQYTCSSDYGNYPIQDLGRYAEYFFPALPANTVSWKVTRVAFHARQAGTPGGDTKVQLQLPTSAGMPSGVVLEEKTLYESVLPLTYLQYECQYTQVSGLSPQQGLCLVFQWQSDVQACELLGRIKDVTAANLFLARTTNRGVSWAKLAGQSLLFSVYGTITTAGTPQIQNTYHLTGVQLRLRAGPDAQATVQAAARTLNKPEVNL